MKFIKGAIAIGVCSLFFAGCSEEKNAGQITSEPRETSEVLKEGIIFTSGVDETGVSYTDTENYANIEGKIYNSDTLHLIYDGTVLEEIPTTADGSFSYYSKANEFNSMITFSTDDNLKFGQQGISIKDLDVAEVVNIIPNSKYIEKINSEEINGYYPEEAANYIKKTYYPSSEIELVQREYANGFQDVYAVGEDVSILLTDDGNIQQIVFHNLKQEEVMNILKDVEYPDDSLITNFLDENKYYFDSMYNNVSTFTYYKNIGVNLVAKSEGMKELQGDNPFSLTLVYDKERLEWFKERN